MTAQKKAEQLLHEYRYLFMNEGEDYGEEILVSLLSTKCALIAVDQIMTALTVMPYGMQYLSAVNYWQNVKQEIEKL